MSQEPRRSGHELRRTRRQPAELEEALAISEDRYRLLYDFAPVGYLTLDVEGTIQSANLTASRLLATPRKGLLGRPFHDYVAPADQVLWHGLRRRVLAAGSDMERLELDLHASDGSVLSANVVAAPELAPALSDLEGIQVVIMDLTLRRRAERAARAGDRRLRVMADALPLLVAYVDQEERFRFRNATCAEWFGLDAEQIDGYTVREVVGEAAYRVLRDSIRKALAGNTVRFAGEIPFQHGARRYVSATCVPDRDRDGRVQGSYAIAEDHTAEHEAALGLRRAASRVAVQDQRDRRRLAADLDSRVVQSLALASIRLQAMEDAVPGQRMAHLQEARALLKEAQQQLGALSFRISPPLLFDVGLLAAAGWLCEQLEQEQGLQTTVLPSEEIQDLGEAARIVLYRCLQEVLAEALHCSGARGTQLRIWRNGDRACMEVVLEGAAAWREPHGPGLISLKDRIRQMGGEFTTDSSSGASPQARVELPVDGGFEEDVDLAAGPDLEP